MNDSAMDSAAGTAQLPAVSGRGEAHMLAAELAGEPARQQHSPASIDALGHPKHTRELFWHYWAPVLTMLSLIGLESTELFSGAHTGRILGALMRWLGHPLSPEALNLLNFLMRKTGHVVGYGLLSLTWLLLLRGSYWLRHEYQLCLKGSIQVRRLWWRPVWAALALMCTATVAIADELHQMSLAGRTGCVRDMVLDTCAAMLAMGLVWHRARRRSARSSTLPA